jgi:hypothetical protein
MSTAEHLDLSQPTGVPQLESVLATMELRALKTAFPDERARIFNLAGDLCFDSGLRERALSYFGRSIDVYLAAEQPEAAVGVCRKIVRLTPEVVRARCTLAWISLGRGLIEEAKQRIADYAAAASEAGQEETASLHLRLMTDVSANVDVLEALAEALMTLGDGAGANRAFGAALGHGQTCAELPEEPAQRWTTVLKLLSGDRPAPFEIQLLPDLEPALELVREPVLVADEIMASEPHLEVQLPIEAVVSGDMPPEPFSMRSLNPRRHSRSRR